MFAKLLKHEFRTSAKSLGLFSIVLLTSCAISFLFSIFLYTSNPIQDNNIWNTITNSLMGFTMFSMVAYGFCVVFIPYSQFYKSKFTDQGYLTFTLPVNTHQILLSSILNTILWALIGIVVLFICTLLLYSPSYVASQDYIDYSNDSSVFKFDILNFLYGTGTLIYAIILPYLSITLGSLVAKKRKLGTAFLIGYGINMVITILGSILMVCINTPDATTYTSIYYGIYIGIYLLIGIGGYFLMHYLIDKKLNT